MSLRRPAHAATAAAVVAVALALPAAAGALPPSTLLSDPATAAVSWPAVAVGADGTAIATWTQYTTSPAQGVLVATRPAGGTWSAPELVSDPDQTTPLTPAVALDGSGDAIVAWEASHAPSVPMTYATKVQAVVRRAGGTWSAPHDLSPATVAGQPGSSAGNPTVAMDAAGDATVAWWPYNDASPAVDVVDHPRDGGWSAMAEVGAGGPPDATPAPRVVLDAAGDAALSWRAPIDATTYVARVALRAAGASAWSAPVDLSAPGHALGTGTIPLGIAATGAATAAWVDTTDAAVRTATLEPGASAGGAPATLGTGANLLTPVLAESGDGAAAAGWLAADATFKRAVATVAHRAADGGAWSPASTVSGPDRYATSLAMATAPGGPARAVWADTDRLHGGPPYPPYIVRGSAFAGAAWGPAGDLTAEADRASNPALAVSPTGDATTVWLSKDGDAAATARVRAALDDVTPPTVAVDGPVSALTGETVSFSATTADVGGPVSVSWSFGDGTPAVGGAGTATHAFATPGTYTVTVTGTDPAGHATTAARTIAVSARPAAPGPPPPEGPAAPAPPAPAPASIASPAPAPAPAPAPTPRPPALSAAGVITLPAAPRSCTSRRTLRITLHAPKGMTITKTTVSVTGRRARAYSGARAHAPITLTGLPKGTYKVAVRVTLSTGKALTLTRRYRTCAAKTKK